MTDWNNKDEVLEAVREDGTKLENASKELRADREVVLAAVANDESYSGEVFKSIDKKLQADKEVILAAVKNDQSCLEYVSDELIDKEVILTALEGGNWFEDTFFYIFPNVGDNAPCWKDKDLNWQLIKEANGLTTLGLRVITRSHPSLWTDKAFVIAMLENLYAVAEEDYYPHVAGYTSFWAQFLDFDAFFNKLQNSPFIDDMEVMLQALKLEYAGDIFCFTSFRVSSCQGDFGIIDLLPDSLINDPEFLREVKESGDEGLEMVYEDLLVLSKVEVIEDTNNVGSETTYLEYRDEKSEKFWEASVEGKTMTRRWGKLGTDGQTHTKEFASTEDAIAEQEKMIASKKAKGYQ